MSGKFRVSGILFASRRPNRKQKRRSAILANERNPNYYKTNLKVATYIDIIMDLEKPSAENRKDSEELLEVKEKLKTRGVDPEKVAEALEQFLVIQRGEASEAIQHYNEAAQELAASMGVEFEEDQHLKFPQINMRISDNDLRRYLRLLRESEGESGATSPMAP